MGVGEGGHAAAGASRIIQKGVSLDSSFIMKSGSRGTALDHVLCGTHSLMRNALTTLDDNPVGEPCNANQFGISSRPLPLRALNAPRDRRDVAYCLSACLIIMDVM